MFWGCLCEIFVTVTFGKVCLIQSPFCRRFLYWMHIVLIQYWLALLRHKMTIVEVISESQDFYHCFSLLFTPSLAHHRCSINISWINEYGHFTWPSHLTNIMSYSMWVETWIAAPISWRLWSTEVKSTDFGTRLFRFKSWFCHFLALYPWKSLSQFPHW